MKVSVFSGTRFSLSKEDADKVLKQLEAVDQSTVFVGDAEGVDKLVRDLVNATVFYAHWTKYGKAAGPMRNEEMLKAATATAGSRDDVTLYAFPSPDSRGTWNCIKCAAYMGIKIVIIPVNLVQEEDNEED